MIKGLLLGAVLAGTLAGPLLAGTSQPEALSRTSKWVVDYDEDACHLAAEFGTGKDMVVMRITRFDLGDPFHFSLYGDRLRHSSSRGEAKLDFGIGEKPIEAGWIGGKNGKLDAMFFSLVRLDGWRAESPGQTGPKLSADQEAAVSGVTVAVRGKKAFRLEFGSLAKPLAQLRTCQETLVKSWGYDPQVESTLSRPIRPVNAITDWFRSNDYPIEALYSRAQGMVQIRLDVDADGKVAGCRILNRSNPDLFADLTCQSATRRAKLLPALDSLGRPVRSFGIYQVRWVMP